MKLEWATTLAWAIATELGRQCSGVEAGTLGFPPRNRKGCMLRIIHDPVYGYPAVNVVSQRESEHSLFQWMRRIIAVRKSSAVFGRGSIEFLYPANHRILAYLRRLGKETVLVVNNLSGAAQAVELDLRRYKGNVLIEMFGNNLFPRVRRSALSANAGTVSVILVSPATSLGDTNGMQ